MTSFSKDFSVSSFHNQKEIYHASKFFVDQGSFLQAKIFLEAKDFSTRKDFPLIMEVFHKQRFFLDRRNFPQGTIFLEAKIFLYWGSFYSLYIYTVPKILKKYFNCLMHDGNKRCCVLT